MTPNPVQELIQEIEFLLKLIAGTQAGESETAKNIGYLISKIKPKL